MFTGIVEERGTVVEAGRRLVVSAGKVADDSTEGSSVAVNGVCLTVVDRVGDGQNGASKISFDLTAETLMRTTLRLLQPRDPVNLERPVTLTTRFGGHVVQGHVDGVGEVVSIDEASPGKVMLVKVPQDLSRYIVDKGSIAVDGVSLTVVNPGHRVFGVALVPHTLDVTTLGTLKKGDSVNLEVDVLAKYVEGLVKQRA
ncbi:MAG TPA: riboflavin synthase [Actinomycetota bacterium]|nr:riboflavin synthase [Actinomycetota bacterium]